MWKGGSEIGTRGAPSGERPNVRQLADRESAVNLNMGTLVGSYEKVARMLDEVAAVPNTGRKGPGRAPWRGRRRWQTGTGVWPAGRRHDRKRIMPSSRRIVLADDLSLIPKSGNRFLETIVPGL